MTDYIEREAAKNILKRHEHRFTCADEANGFGSVKWSEYVIYSETAQNCMDALPAADVRPVVLCKDCVHYEMGVCLKIYDDGAANKDAWQERKPDDYCSYGEDRNDPTNCGTDMRNAND